MQEIGFLARNKMEKIIKRVDKYNYYLDIAQSVLQRGTCLRRNYGAVIVKNDEIISTGYTGAPRGRVNCIDINFCYREYNKIPSGQMYEKCRSVHAEMNAIISASRDKMIDSDLYLVGITESTGEYVKNTQPCSMCRRLIINSGIKRVISRENKTEYLIIDVKKWIENDDSLIDIGVI